MPSEIGVTAGFSDSKLSTRSPDANVCVKLPGSAEIAITGPNDPNTAVTPINILPIVRWLFATRIIPTINVRMMKIETLSSVSAVAFAVSCFIFFVSRRSESERLFTSSLR